MMDTQSIQPTLIKANPRSSRAKKRLETSLEDGLGEVIQVMKTEMDKIMANLEASQSTLTVNEDSMVYMKMINAVELMQMHLEFTREVLLSKTEDEVVLLKKRFSLISASYNKINSREDVSQVPVKSVVEFMKNKMHDQLKRVLGGCFRMNKKGEVKMNNTANQLAQIKILAFKFEVGALYYPLVVQFSKEDIFSYDKSSPLWQDLYKLATFKKIISKREIHTSFKPFRLLLHMSYYLVKTYIEDAPSINLKTVCSFLQDILYYGTQADKAEVQALLYLIKPNIDHVFKTWNATDHPFLLRAIELRIPKVRHDQLIHVPRLFPMITKEVILKEYHEKTLNKLNPIEKELIDVPDYETIQNMQADILEDLFIKSDEKVQIRILAPETINIPTYSQDRQGAQFSSFGSTRHDSTPSGQEQAIVIHIHGGGFVAMSSASHKIYLTRWVKNLKLIHFCIDYRLAPQHQYPCALDDVWQAYLWIMNYATTVFGIKTSKVILAGDSAGGNLCLVLALRLIRAGLPPPDGLYLIYPALIMNERTCSPSYYQALEDPILHYSLLKLCLKAYVSEEFNPVEDPFLSPLIASEELLEKLPPIRIVSGSEDPLHDDSWRLVARLRKLQKDVRIIIHEHMGHGFMSHQDLKNYDLYIEEGCELIKELVDLAMKK